MTGVINEGRIAGLNCHDLFSSPAVNFAAVDQNIPLPPLFRALSPAALAALLRGAESSRFRRGDVLFRSLMEPRWAYWLQSGSLKLMHELPQGPRIVHLGLPGEVIGLASIAGNRPYALTALGLGAGEVLALDRARVLEAIHQEQPFCEALLKQLAQDLTDARIHLALQGGLPVQVRLARLLLDLDQRTRQIGGQHDLTELKLTRFDLADILGAAQETVSRNLGRLERAGLIVRTGRSLKVKDATALRALAESDPPPMKQPLTKRASMTPVMVRPEGAVQK